MKLLELLVKERIEWPIKYEKLAQDGIGRITVVNSPLRMEISSLSEVLPVADDWQTAIVTKERYDLACKLVDNGYTLWFGGECPVQGDTRVDVWVSTGVKGDAQYFTAKHWRWEWEDGLDNIIAYRIELGVENSIRSQLTISTDVVNHPSHYTNGKVECIDAIEAATVGKTGIEAICVANVIKYLWRYEDKNGLEDIKKAQWYLNKLIEVKK